MGLVTVSLLANPNLWGIHVQHVLCVICMPRRRLKHILEKFIFDRWLTICGQAHTRIGGGGG